MASLFIEKLATGSPVLFSDLTNFLRVDSNADNNNITTMLNAATSLCEKYTARSLCFKGYRQSLDAFPYFSDSAYSQQAYPPAYSTLPRYSTSQWNYSQQIKLLVSPVASVDRITYLSSADKQWHDLVPTPPLWYPGTTYAVSNKVMDNNGNVQQCTAPGKSGANPPTWNATQGQTTTEPADPTGEGSGPVAWLNLGPFASMGQFGAFIADTDSEPARVFPGPPGSPWPQVLYVPGAVQIHFTAGYSADNTLVPAAFQQAIYQTCAHWYENRESVAAGNYTELPNSAKALLFSHRVLDYSPTRG